MLRARVEDNEINDRGFETAAAGGANQPNDLREFQFPSANLPDQPEAGAAIGTRRNAECGHGKAGENGQHQTTRFAAAIRVVPVVRTCCAILEAIY